MKKLTIYLVLLLALPVLLQAQYMGGNGNGNATFSLTNVSLSVHRIAVELPSKYELYQNFPNPFNPMTKIKFSIKELGFVTLKVYDVMGRVMETLVNEKLPEGTYEIDFNASQISSGVYFYKLVVGNFSEIKKLLLIK